MDRSTPEHLYQAFVESYDASLRANSLPHTNAIIILYVQGSMQTERKIALMQQIVHQLRDRLCYGALDAIVQKIWSQRRLGEARLKLTSAAITLRNLTQTLDDHDSGIHEAYDDIENTYLRVIDDVRYAEERMQDRIADVPDPARGCIVLRAEFRKRVESAARYH